MLRLVRDTRDEPRPPDLLAAVAGAAVAGDPRAVRTFLVTIGPHVLRTARRVLGASHPDVDDVAQESAYAVLEALPGVPACALAP